MRAAIYLRVSTAEQANPERFSLPAQERACRALAENRGWEIAGVYADEGESAALDDPRRRPQFAALLQDAQRGAFDAIIVHKLDRFARTLRGALEWMSVLEKAGVALVSTSEPVDFTSPTGRLFFSLLCAFSQYFIDNLREEVRKGADERALRGYWRGDPPFGYCRGQCRECAEPNGSRCPRYRQAEPLGSGRELYVHPWEEEIRSLVETAPDPAPLRAALQAKLERLTWLFQEGDIDRADYTRRRAAILSEMDRMRPPARSDVERVGRLLEDIGRLWQEAGEQAKRGLLRSIFEAIFIDGSAPSSPTISGIRPLPSVLPWWKARVGKTRPGRPGPDLPTLR